MIDITLVSVQIDTNSKMTCNSIKLSNLSMDFLSRFPPILEAPIKPWGKTYGTDYYGALQVAADYCGLGNVPSTSQTMWQHGTNMPWYKIRPEIIVYDAPRSYRCLVARKDEADFLKAGGYLDVRSIGLPIVYTKPSGLARISDSLLVMPTHTCSFDIITPSGERYVREIASIVGKFKRVAACVSASCITKGVWVKEFKGHGIPVVRGSGLNDANSLKRMRALFESFEYVTTDNYGSHVFYALYFGAKVSIWGEPTPWSRENFLRDGAWAPYPEAVDKLFSEETNTKAEVYLGPLRVKPWVGVNDVDTGKFLVGHDNKLNPTELRACFGWTPAKVFASKLDKVIRRSRFWRLAASLKHRLLAVGIP